MNQSPDSAAAPSQDLAPADLLRLADSDDLVTAWSREHHLPEAEWTVPVELGQVLRTADDAS